MQPANGCAGGKGDTAAAGRASALVVGAGVAGIRAAFDLAEAGYRVLLTDSSPAVGGILAKLDYQFPSDHCGMCKMLPLVGREYASQYCMRRSLFHDNIEILPFTTVEAIDGEPGAFTVKLRRKARHVDAERCSGTGLCIDVCPVSVPDEFNHGLTQRKAIYRPVPHNLPNVVIVDTDSCNRCGECVKACPVDAIDLGAQDCEIERQVDALIFAAGTGLYDPASPRDLTCYGVSRDVVTSLEFERMLSASGTYAGRLERPSDGKPIRSIAWLQCVGSRNRKAGRDYCSSICCMFALKEAVLAKEKGGPDTEAFIFYMDMRTFGKDFHRYRVKAEEEHGVELVRCRVHQVIRTAEGLLRVRFLEEESQTWRHKDFDLVVLSTGQAPHHEMGRLAALIGLAPPRSGYLAAPTLEKVRTPRPGVFMCGSFMGLGDISEALVSGGAAAGLVSRLVHGAGRGPEAEPARQAERPIATELPQVCVVLCDWNHQKKGLVRDLEPLRRMLLARRGVAEVHVIEHLCTEQGLEQLAGLLRATRSNRVLLGACLPYVYRGRLKGVAQAAGFNPLLVEVVDLKGGMEGRLGRRPEDALLAGLVRLREADALEEQRLEVSQRALVIGGGPAGMSVSLSLADRGIGVDLVEREDALGGWAGAHLRTLLEGLDPQAAIEELKARTLAHAGITVHTRSEVVASEGSVGAFVTRVRAGNGAEVSLRHGATVVCTGGLPAPSAEYHLGESDRVINTADLDDHLASGRVRPEELANVVMIQCVGSREHGGREWCSRVCCPAALKHALALRERNPEVRVLVLYRDMMTPGFLEEHYTRARRAGVLFASYRTDAKPEVTLEGGRPHVKYHDPVLDRDVELGADLVCLSTGVAPAPATASLARTLRVEVNRDGFFQEAEPKWRPVDFLREGVYLAGTCHSPRSLADVLTQAEAAAQRAFVLLRRRQIVTARVVSRVRDSLCARCQACVVACPYGARSLDPVQQRIVVDSAACQACGLCASACPNSAAEVLGTGDRQVMTILESVLEAGAPGHRPGA